MLDVWARCQAHNCANPAVVKIKSVGLCSEHVEELNQHVNGSYQGWYSLETKAILAVVTGLSRALAG